ncbi:MAG: SUMF1/EgtB/PvdO family nonheme iron enzyme [Limnohabitans sp.]|nr:SUMF1/EgtB/PvdO family nonheme iron enzyme [Limnohabitans sp.]
MNCAHIAPRVLALLLGSLSLTPATAAPVLGFLPLGVLGDECKTALEARLGLNDAVNTATMTASANAPAAGECQFLNWLPTTKDAWWVYDAPTAGRMSLHFCTSNFDTSVVVYQGSCSALTRIACDDDGCAPTGPGFQSKIDGLPVSAGPVYIRVGGYGGATGTAQFTLDFKPDGRVVSWGRNIEGQRSVPASLGAVAVITAGDAHSVALKPDGTVACWGLDDEGQCTVPDLLSGVIAIAAGQEHSVALTSGGVIGCWGGNLYGQCNTPVNLAWATAISAGAFHSMAITAGGTVVCWGQNTSGQCNVPSSLGPVAAIAGGGFHSAALRPDGTVACWGSNTSGQCNVPVSLSTVTAIAAGDAHTVALRSNGNVVCWGSNFFSQCVVPPSTLGTVKAIAAGDGHTIALKADGAVVCWGASLNGQSNVPASLGTVSSIAGGGSHTMAVVPYTCAADLDGDGSSGAADLSGLLAAWGTNNASFDLDGDGSVGASDLSMLLTSWGACDAAPPSVANLSPNSGPLAGGTRVTITGTNLSAVTGVTIGGAAATNVVALSPTTVSAVTPARTAGAKTVSVTGADGSANLPNGFTYTNPWYTVLEQDPNPFVVTSATLRNAIVATGLPWRVRDNGTNIEMVLIPPGTFIMGCSASNAFACDPSENPTHSVTLTNAFYIGRYEVTQAQWTAKMGSNPSGFQSASAEVPAAQVPLRPVEGVSWNMIQGFLSGTGLRLPTEAEWEFAYRAGTTTAFHSMPGFPNGTNDDTQVGNIAWFGSNSFGQPRPVGGKAANALGLHDMSGNVLEWMNDWYSATYYASSPSTNPSGPATGASRVLRGGSWNIVNGSLRASRRIGITPGVMGADNVGFRVARNPV